MTTLTHEPIGTEHGHAHGPTGLMRWITTTDRKSVV